MNPESRLAEIVSALEIANVPCLVMGGHAVRFYGLSRNTIDFDLHITPDRWDDLPERLGAMPLFAGRPVSEGPSWRPQSFRRFQIGRLPDGREEWLEFWSGNHLLAPFAELYARRETGAYGGRVLPFLSLRDLIRSKETERTVDWQDVSVLEEFLDARLLAEATANSTSLTNALGSIRSRRGFESALQQEFLANPKIVEQALQRAPLAITQAFLLPFNPMIGELPLTSPAIEPVIMNHLRSVAAASPLHLTLVEAVRRQYRLAAQAVDKADKERIRRSQSN